MSETADELRVRVANEINRVIKWELDEVETLIKKENNRKALSVLDDAVRKLKRLKNSL